MSKLYAISIAYPISSLPPSPPAAARSSPDHAAFDAVLAAACRHQGRGPRAVMAAAQAPTRRVRAPPTGQSGANDDADSSECHSAKLVARSALHSNGAGLCATYAQVTSSLTLSSLALTSEPTASARSVSAVNRSSRMAFT